MDETLCFSLKFKNGGMANVSSNLTVPGENTAVIFGDKANIKVLSLLYPGKILVCLNLKNSILARQ